MKLLFYLGLFLLAAFEILNVYFIMPMPGSQEMTSIDTAYFLYTYRWFFRVTFLLMIIVGTRDAFKTTRRWIPLVSMIPVLVILYIFNFKMTADHMFLQPKTLTFAPRPANVVADSSLVIAVEQSGEAKAYPIRYILYHHQVRDTVGGRPVMVTYCNVCRTGRIFEPAVEGTPETFRLVGMDHYNAMFEDATTKSWWRQVTGEAIAGPKKGLRLPEIESNQLTVGRFFDLYPFGKVMQPEKSSMLNYDTLGRFENGLSTGRLTRRDSLSWQAKSWVVGVIVGERSKAYDWNELVKVRTINDNVGGTPIVVALSDDLQSFVSFERPDEEPFMIRNDTLISAGNRYDLRGISKGGSRLKSVPAYQEFWHSWKTFHPDTERSEQN